MNFFTKIFYFTFLLCTLNALRTPDLKAQLVPDFRVNDDTTNQSQYDGKLGVDQLGNFTIVWTDWREEGIDGVNTNVYCQRFSSNGNFIGNNFRINEVSGTSSSPSIAVRNDGSFLVCWKDFSVKARIFNNQGIAKGPSFVINDSLTNRVFNTPSVGSDSKGNFVICWQEYVIGQYGNIYYQRLDSMGIKIGHSEKVNDDTVNIDHRNPSISVRKDGNFIITWNDTRPPAVPNKDDIYFQMYDSNGFKIGMNQKVNDDPGADNLQHSPKVSVDSSRQFVIAWNDDRLSHSNNEVYAQRFSSNGNYIGQNFRVTQSSLSITKGFSSLDKKPNGDFVVYWTEFLNPSGIPYFQRFRNDGSFIGNNFRVTDQSLSTEKFSSDIKVFNNRIICIWSDERNGPFDVYCNIRSFTNPDTTVSIINNSSLIPEAFKLSQNYPNPFNSGTKINYEIILSGRYSMEVFNILGQNVKILFDKILKQGKYETFFSSENFVSGLYFYSISSDNERIIKKLLILK